MRQSVQERPDVFAGQVFFVGIDVHKKKWTCSVLANRMSLDKPVVIDPCAKALSSFLRHCYPGGMFQAIYEIPAIVFLTTMLLATGLIDIRRFKTVEDLVDFADLVSRGHQSDETSYRMGLNTQGDAELRLHVIEEPLRPAKTRP